MSPVHTHIRNFCGRKARLKYSPSKRAIWVDLTILFSLGCCRSALVFFVLLFAKLRTVGKVSPGRSTGETDVTL